MMVYLERVGPDRNMRRFYRLTVTPSLFGEWALIREWGRIGSQHGQRMEEWFSVKASATDALARLAAAKRRKGYAGMTVGAGRPISQTLSQPQNGGSSPS